MDRSIIQDYKERCYLCGSYGPLERHHVIFGTANRRLSEEDGLVVYLCPGCHRIQPWAAHKNSETDRFLKRVAQIEWECRYGGREEFIARYGKNFL